MLTMFFQYVTDLEDESQKRFDLQVGDLLAQFGPICLQAVAHKALRRLANENVINGKGVSKWEFPRYFTVSVRRGSIFRTRSRLGSFGEWTLPASQTIDPGG